MPPLPTGEGFLYPAVVLDVFGRRIVGWAMSNHLNTALMLRALDMALPQHKLTGRGAMRSPDAPSHRREKTPAEALDECLKSVQQSSVATTD